MIIGGTLFLSSSGSLSSRTKDKAKMKLWGDYLKENGRNLGLVRRMQFIRLVRIGSPNILRGNLYICVLKRNNRAGEIWEMCSGAMLQRYLNEGYYEKLHSDNIGKLSLSLEEIEKDLNRSLPEYGGYQTEEGINALRRVLYVRVI